MLRRVRIALILWNPPQRENSVRCVRRGTWVYRALDASQSNPHVTENTECYQKEAWKKYYMCPVGLARDEVLKERIHVYVDKPKTGLLLQILKRISSCPSRETMPKK